ncbi:hypothetical protein MRY87_13555 [bacterium]|nr:hypothetical protein [bacterium]
MKVHRLARVSRVIIVAAVFFGASLFSETLRCAEADETEEVPTVHGRVVLGYVERILLGKGIELEAILSPVHHHSELGVHDLSLSNLPEGGRLASFSLRGKKGKTQEFSLKVLDKKDTASRGKDVVVRVPICLGNYELTPHFRLVDRSKYDQEVRLGRRILSGRVVIDPSATHAAVPMCKKMKKDAEERSE